MMFLMFIHWLLLLLAGDISFSILIGLYLALCQDCCVKIVSSPLCQLRYYIYYISIYTSLKPRLLSVGLDLCLLDIAITTMFLCIISKFSLCCFSGIEEHITRCISPQEDPEKQREYHHHLVRNSAQTALCSFPRRVDMQRLR